ncbi:fumarate reductase (quinol) flavoprotein subunit [Candidatus Providencia siddallii]|uniref:Fumarate reductase flavoprotein subunit n=1 Tax=Candidatus Providencia siddallii TaxID=1715285 RepID=A0ABM9NP63_9GAMM
MNIINTDLAIIGSGGAGLRAAIAAAEKNNNIKISIISKVYPMRSHTVAAEGGSAAVIQSHDSYDYHFNDTVSGGDWLCEQDVVEYFVKHCPIEMTQLELWGCPWSRKKNGEINVRRFGGMKIERTWFAADKTGFHILHTLFQTSLKYSQIKRFDEFFVLDIIVDENQIHGLIAIDMMEGKIIQINAKAIIIATGGACRLYHYNTNGGIVTGDGMCIAFRHGIPLRDMEFIQYHPTGLPGTGILITEGCRGEGGVLINKDGYRYLQDYGLGPETLLGKPENKYMELGPRDKISQAFWHEWRAGKTINTNLGDVVHLDLRHIGEKKLYERLPFICELAKSYIGINPVNSPIPVRPTAHYTMGGIETNNLTKTRINGLFAVGECSSIGLHGANRLGSNSLAELVVFGRLAGEEAVSYIEEVNVVNNYITKSYVSDIKNTFNKLLNQNGTENFVKIRNELCFSMEEYCGIYRTANLMEKLSYKISELKERFKHIKIIDQSSVYNTNLFCVIELGFGLDIAECIVHSAINRKESRGAHQRLDENYILCDNKNFLKHTLAFYNNNEIPRIEYSDVKITKLNPAKRVYGNELSE